MLPDSILIPFEYDEIEKGEFGYYIEQDKKVLIVTKGAKKGIIDYQNKIIVLIEYENITYPYGENTKISLLKDKKIGYLDEKWNAIFSDDVINLPAFDAEAVSFTDSLILAYGEPIIELDCHVEDLSEYPCDYPRHFNRYAHCNGFMNHKGDWIIPVRFWDAKPFEEGLAPVSVKGKWGYIDRTGTVVIPCTFTDAACFNGGVALVQMDNSYYFINQKGEKTNKEVTIDSSDYFGMADRFSLMNEGYYVTEKRSGRKIYFDPYHYPLQEGRQAFQEGRYWGFMDENKKILVLPQYKAVSNFQQGVAMYQKEDKDPWGLLSHDGKRLTSNDFEKESGDSFELTVTDNQIVTSINEHYGSINTAGKTVIPFIYSKLEPFKSGLARFQDEVTKKWGIINTQNKIIVPAEYEYYDYESALKIQDSMVITYQYGDGSRLIDFNGKTRYKTEEPLHFVGDGWFFDFAKRQFFQLNGNEKALNFNLKSSCDYAKIVPFSEKMATFVKG
ncbi:MAG: hypothetical protein RLZZ292_1882, partial [Bacteroidota bacterium]